MYLYYWVTKICLAKNSAINYGSEVHHQIQYNNNEQQREEIHIASCLHPFRFGSCSFIIGNRNIWQITWISEIVRSFKHLSISVEWYEGYHKVVRLMSHGWHGNGNIGRVLSLWVSWQPFIEHTINHCVMNDKQRIIWRSSYIFNLSCLIRREVGSNITGSWEYMSLWLRIVKFVYIIHAWIEMNACMLGHQSTPQLITVQVFKVSSPGHCMAYMKYILYWNRNFCMAYWPDWQRYLNRTIAIERL